MEKKALYALWGVFFILCAGLGFIPEAEGMLRGTLTAAAVVFFLFPGWLLFAAVRDRDRMTIRVVRNLSALSLVLTVALLSASILTAAGSEWLGNFLHGVLVVVSTPMVCSGHWALSLFLWACLLIGAQKGLKHEKTTP